MTLILFLILGGFIGWCLAKIFLRCNNIFFRITLFGAFYWICYMIWPLDRCCGGMAFGKIEHTASFWHYPNKIVIDILYQVYPVLQSFYLFPVMALFYLTVYSRRVDETQKEFIKRASFTMCKLLIITLLLFSVEILITEHFDKPYFFYMLFASIAGTVFLLPIAWKRNIWIKSASMMFGVYVLLIYIIHFIF